MVVVEEQDEQKEDTEVEQLEDETCGLDHTNENRYLVVHDREEGGEEKGASCRADGAALAYWTDAVVIVVGVC